MFLAQNENLKWKIYIGKALCDVMWDCDITSGNIFIGDSLEEVFGYIVENNTISFLDFVGWLPQRERGTVKKGVIVNTCFYR